MTSQASRAASRIALTCVAVVAATPVRAQAPSGVAFVDVNVLTMSDRGALAGQTVLVRGDSIAAMGPIGEVQIPDGVETIEGRGGYLLPGLADMHVHLSDTSELLSYLRYGVTTVLQLSGQRGQVTDFLTLRDAIDDGEVLGPRLFLAGPMFADPSLATQTTSYVYHATEDVADLLSRHVEAGYDFVKVHNFTPAAVYRTLLDGPLPVVGHLPIHVGLVALRTKSARFVTSCLRSATFVRRPTSRIQRSRVRGARKANSGLARTASKSSSTAASALRYTRWAVTATPERTTSWTSVGSPSQSGRIRAMHTQGLSEHVHGNARP